MSTATVPAAQHPNRRIGLEHVHNFRDLGGYPTAAGKATKWNTLFRSDGLYRLRSADDISRVQQLQLRSVSIFVQSANKTTKVFFPQRKFR